MSTEKRLLIQIPCFNEEKTLPEVIQDIRSVIRNGIPGISEIAIQIINDGSTDKTVEVAKKLGVNYIVNLPHNSGLGIAFKKGVENALLLGYDILINTDGDHQYPAKYIPKLVKPILDNKADIVIGDRAPDKVKHFSKIKRFFQWLGKVGITWLLRTDIKDPVSGFRAYSRYSLLEMTLTERFSYVLDTTIQAVMKKMRIVTVPITINKPTRPSRLFKNIFQHIRKTIKNIFNVYMLYNAVSIFMILAFVFAFVGSIPILRFLYFYIFDPTQSAGHIQSLILGTIFIVTGTNIFMLSILTIILVKNRVILEDILYFHKRYGLNEKTKK